MVCFLIGAIVVSFGVALADANPGFGKTLTTTQMANMFGGGWVLCGDRDCDTTSGSCPGGSTCNPGQTEGVCQLCQTVNGDKCGAAGGAGWQCVDGTASCNGEKGFCVEGSCEKHATPETPPNCSTRPDC